MKALARFYLIDRVVLWWEGWVLFARIIELNRAAQKAVQGGLQKDEKTNAEDAWADFRTIASRWFDNRDFIFQWRLFRKALRWNVPFPPGGDHFGSNLELRSESGVVLLKRDYVNQFRDAIRKESEYRRATIVGWITPFTGIFGVLVGAILTWLLM